MFALARILGTAHLRPFYFNTTFPEQYKLRLESDSVDVSFTLILQVQSLGVLDFWGDSVLPDFYLLFALGFDFCSL